MDGFDLPEIKDAISGISKKLNITLDVALQIDYQNGKYPSLLSYEKVEKPVFEIPIIQKYLIGAQTNLNQPCNFYDIFRLCRHVLLVKKLNEALTTIINDVDNFESRLNKLRNATSYDDFEAVLYEIITAANYCTYDKNGKVRFLPEEELPSPDFEIIKDASNIFIECKKYDRSVDLSYELRNLVREKTRKIVDELIKFHKSAVVELSFQKDPHNISINKIRDYAIESLKTGVPVVDEEIVVRTVELSHIKLDSYTLYPSPKYFWERYGYRERSEWFGIVLGLNARFAHHHSVAGMEDGLTSTWLDDIDWECAIKWKITDPETIWQLKRLGYSRLFQGLNQLQSKGTNSILHCWFERDYALGPRKNELEDFFDRLKISAKDIFAWIIFNETCFDVSLEGRFDLVEHAHIIRGPGAISTHPDVTAVFTAHDEDMKGLGKFGIGTELPDVDELYKV